MTYTGLEFLMKNLKQMIYCNEKALIKYPRSILFKWSEIHLLYVELTSMIQSLFVDIENDLNELKQVEKLQKIFKDVAEKSHNVISLLVYNINNLELRYNFNHTLIGDSTIIRAINSEVSLNLENVMKSINFIKKEFNTIIDNQEIDSSQLSINCLKMQITSGTSHTRNPLGIKKVSEEMIVGLERDAELIRDKLVEDQKKLDVVSIVGTGGIGKTTLAMKVFMDPFIMYYFCTRAWVTVSQTYGRRDLLIQILESTGIEFDPVIASNSLLGEKLYKSLKDKRYLIVVDDLWSIDAWSYLKLYLPDDNKGSRILLTSRLKEVALHAKAHGFVHQLEYLTDQESWELLHKKVFQANCCPKSLIKPGMEIAKNCHGLPLAVAVIAGVLAKEPLTKDSWEKIAQSVSTYIVNDRNGVVDMLALSYDHLPPHLKDCFLYLGGFPEDHKFQVQMLIWLWMAEGFIQEIGNRSLEETGEDYLMELVDRNLLLVDREFDGSIKFCSIHDLLREICLEKATNEGFLFKIHTPMNCLTSTRPRRIFTHVDIFTDNIFENRELNSKVNSLLCFDSDACWTSFTDRFIFSQPLLMVLDLQECQLSHFPMSMKFLVHLRYLALWYDRDFPSSICNLWSLQTLIIRSSEILLLPKEISNMVNLRHLWSYTTIHITSIEKPLNLQTISEVVLVKGAKSWVKYFHGIKKLTTSRHANADYDFKSLKSLETLMSRSGYRSSSYSRPKYFTAEFQKIHLRLPVSLKKLSLAGPHLTWSDMPIIHSLPNLESLEILDNAFVGYTWATGDEQFRQLKYLKLEQLNIQQWQASSINFPCLVRLVVADCDLLEEIPHELGDIPTLELIENYNPSRSVANSLNRIRKEQEDMGNCDLKIKVKRYGELLTKYGSV